MIYIYRGFNLKRDTNSDGLHRNGFRQHFLNIKTLCSTTIQFEIRIQGKLPVSANLHRLRTSTGSTD